MPTAPFVWEPGDEVLVSSGGLGVVGMLFHSLPLGKQRNGSILPGAQEPEISHRDVVASYLGLLTQGKNDFDHVEALREDDFFAVSLGLARVPSSPTLRQRLDQAASAVGDQWKMALLDGSDELLRRHARCAPLHIGTQDYVPLDIDVSPFDNGKTKKEGVSRTYKGCDGFAPVFGYLGQQGWALAG